MESAFKIAHVALGCLTLFSATTLTPRTATATTSVDQCHQLAADPDDPMKAAGAPGIPDGEIGDKAIEACRDAVNSMPDDAVLNYQLGRSLIEWGQIEAAAEPLRRAAEAGEPAALYLYALLLRETGSGTPDGVTSVLDRSRQGGYAPAGKALEDLASASKDTESKPQLDYSAFEQPSIIKALVEGDAQSLENVQIGIVAESFSGPMGFVTYFEGFSSALSGPYFCPALLPAGAAKVLQAQMANRVIDTTMKDPVESLMKPGGLLETMVKQGETLAKRPDQYVKGAIAGQTAIAVLPEQGTKDAMIIINLGNNGDSSWGCNGTASLAIAKTVRGLMNM
ncbi:tetratricopeptide repeat protein [Rhizobium brockwellii]|uniref:tetratricopeptide repeat protein n=1 Tax=Rhizobium brockwellii TaxID=3019932 RepID=UPI003F94CF85